MYYYSFTDTQSQNIPVHITSRMNAMIDHNTPVHHTSINHANLISLNEQNLVDMLSVSSTIKFSHFNARSVRNKTVLLNEFILENNLDIFAVTETWLSSDANYDQVTIGELLPVGY